MKTHRRTPPLAALIAALGLAGWPFTGCAGSDEAEQKGECEPCQADAECGPGLLCHGFTFSGDPNTYYRCSTAPSQGGSNCTR